MATIANVYTLTNVKGFNGMEGRGLNAVIRRNDKPVAYVLDEGCGGEIQIDFRNPLYNPKSFKAATPEMAKAEDAMFSAFVADWYVASGTEAEDVARWAEWNECKVEAVPHKSSAHDMMTSWVCRQADEIESKKSLDRTAKKKTLFRLEGDSDEAWRTLTGGAYCPAAQAWLDKKYGAKVVAIYGVK